MVLPHEPGVLQERCPWAQGETMTTARSAAALVAAACLAVLAGGCASHGTAPGPGAARSPGPSTTAAPSATASAPAPTAPVTTRPAGQASAPRCQKLPVAGLLSPLYEGLTRRHATRPILSRATSPDQLHPKPVTPDRLRRTPPQCGSPRGARRVSELRRRLDGESAAGANTRTGMGLRQHLSIR